MQMKISRESFRGTGKVYRFTLEQMLKGKAYLISAGLFLLIALASVPVMTLLLGQDSAKVSKISAVYVQNDTGYDLPLGEIPQRYETFADTTFTETDLTEDTYGEQLQPSEVFVHISRDTEQGGFQLTAFNLDSREFFIDELSQCTNVLTELLDEARFSSLNVSEEQMQVLMSGYDVNTRTVKEFLNRDEENIDARMNIQMLYCAVVLILDMFVIVYIIQKVIEEKASRLVEFMLVSVQPLALLLGKILAAMTYVFGQLVLMLVLFALSYVVTGMFMDTSVIAQGLAQMGISLDLLRLTPQTAVIIVVSLFLAYVMVSLFSGLVGACCSTMEDVEPANMVVTLCVMAGYLVSVSTAGTKMPVLAAVTSLVPFVSMFAAPVRYLLGDIGLGMVALSLVLQLLVILLLAYFCAKMYRDLLMYRGERLRLGRFLSMARQRSKEVRK